MLAVEPGEEACRVEEERVCGDEDNVGNAISVEVLWSEIKSTWVEVDHCDALSDWWGETRRASGAANQCWIHSWVGERSKNDA